jgi:hypothetical protein
VTVDDMVIETLADSESALRARVASLEADVIAYRQMTYAALCALNRVTARYERLRASAFPSDASAAQEAA